MTTTGDGVLDGLVNLRDLGGMDTEQGHRTRPGVLYRSDAPHPGDRPPRGWAQWPPAAVVDLRDAREQETSNHPLTGPDTVVHRIPLLEEVHNAHPQTEWIPELADLYQVMLQHAATKLVEVLEIVAQAAGPVLLHCSAGKDRTGVVSAMLLRTVGVPEADVVADYVRTGENMPHVLRRIERKAPVTPPGVEKEKVDELMAAPPEAIAAVLRTLDSHEDGAAGWLLEHGAAQVDLQRWRERFIT